VGTFQKRRIGWSRMNRLFVTSLKSIGLVHAGDNPGSEVQIWKSHTEREISDLLSGPILGEPGSSHTSTATSTTATVDQRIRSMARRIADMKRLLADMNQRILNLKKRRENQRPARLANIERTTPMTDKETPQDIDELVMAKLDSFARRSQFEGEMKGAWGHESTPREAMVTKIKARWWETPDGRAVKDLLRERARERSRPASLVAIQKTHSEAYAAIGRLDG